MDELDRALPASADAAPPALPRPRAARRPLPMLYREHRKWARRVTAWCKQRVLDLLQSQRDGEP